MGSSLVIAVRWHQGRYEGTGHWPPSPARLFQALVAGVGSRAEWSQDDTDAFRWLERLDPPVVAAPPHTVGQRFREFLPNNDLDAVGGDPRNIAKIRGATKDIRPVLFDERRPVLYAWSLEPGNDGPLNHVLGAANFLFQLGRGRDMAWAWGEVMPSDVLERTLLEYSGPVLRPAREGRMSLRVPTRGSLKSLHRRYQAYGQRFDYKRSGQKVSTILRQVPAPSFALSGYGASPRRQLYELHRVGEPGFAPQAVENAVAIATAVRDAAANRLAKALPGDGGPVAVRALTGKPRDRVLPIAARIKVIPLASIGHDHADRQLRRILVEIPDQCPTPYLDIEWALSGLMLSMPGADAPFATLTAASGEAMLAHYGIGRPSTVWRTVTPVAVPSRGDDPGSEPRRNGRQRHSSERRVAHALRQALRHAEVSTDIERIRVQKEPFEAHGRRAEEFAAARFHATDLWHVEICFAESVDGPLVVGNGRFLGLGLLAPPVRDAQGDG
ncbi:MAG: type I-U CRISPR-associated protein Csb2 [Myxococcota bacterium]